MQPMAFHQLSKHLFEIPKQGSMKVPARVYWPSTKPPNMNTDNALAQLVGVAQLPGIVGYALAMPDIHWGYGFPIGGVAAMDAKQGAISPGGVGYDINCGIRLVATDLEAKSIKKKMIHTLLAALYNSIPVGVGASHALPKLGESDLRQILQQGAKWALDRGFQVGQDDLDRCEDAGCLKQADPDAVSPVALERGATQVGTLGSGNHFVEIDVVDHVFDDSVAQTFGLWQGQLVLQIHTGSRGLGHQVCDDALAVLVRKMGQFGPEYANISDRQLACAPINSPEGKTYLGAMQAADNFAWANRQVINGICVQTMQQVFSMGPSDLRAQLVYDVCHNIAKMEQHIVPGAGKHERQLIVHRKGATRAMGPTNKLLSPVYRTKGQPVLVPGDMGRKSYVLVGTNKAEKDTFGSACHGAGRLLSRHQAKKSMKGRHIAQELVEAGIEVLAKSKRTLVEEASSAYKDVDTVVQCLADEGIVGLVARLKPLGVIKG